MPDFMIPVLFKRFLIKLKPESLPDYQSQLVKNKYDRLSFQDQTLIVKIAYIVR